MVKAITHGEMRQYSVHRIEITIPSIQQTFTVRSQIQAENLIRNKYLAIDNTPRERSLLKWVRWFMLKYIPVRSGRFLDTILRTLWVGQVYRSNNKGILEINYNIKTDHPIKGRVAHIGEKGYGKKPVYQPKDPDVINKVRLLGFSKPSKGTLAKKGTVSQSGSLSEVIARNQTFREGLKPTRLGGTPIYALNDPSAIVDYEEQSLDYISKLLLTDFENYYKGIKVRVIV